MNILMVHSSYPPLLYGGGCANSLKSFAEEFVLQGHSVTICTTNKDVQINCDVGYSIKNGVKIYRFPIKYLKRWAFAPRLFFFLKERIRSYDIVHIWSIFGFHSFVTANFAKRYGIPFIVSPHGNLSPVAMQKNKLLKTICLKIFEHTSFNETSAIHCSTEIDKQWPYLKSISNKNIFVVPIGIHQPPAQLSNSNIVLYNNYILFLGRIHQIKGLKFLCDIISTLPNSCKSTKLLLAGPDNDNYLEKILLYAKQKGIFEKIVYVGNLGEIEKYEYIRKARFLVLPSYSENFGIVVIEAMACGVPVVVSDKCNIKIYVEKANCGFVIPHEIKSFQDKFILLLTNLEVRYSLGQNGLKYYKNNLTIEKAASKMLMKYEDIINSK